MQLDNQRQEYIRRVYSLGSDSDFSLLNAGENHTYLIVDHDEKYVLRQYRKNRYGFEIIQAELEWLSALKDHLLLPNAIRNKMGEQVTSFQNETGTTECFVLFEWIDGAMIDHPSGSDYEKLGRIMRILHQASDEIYKKLPTITEWKRPEYNEVSTIHYPLVQLLSAPFLSTEEKERCIKIAETLSLFSKKYDMGDTGFLHGDMHFGNILQAENGCYCLDFDESGFGYRVFDIGVPRLHLIASGQLQEMWSFFMSGYGVRYSEEAIRIGTGLRIFYMAGKIPGRLDIENIRQQPEVFIKRYLHFIEEELSWFTSI